jgi:hypothetical protein
LNDAPNTPQTPTRAPRLPVWALLAPGIVASIVLVGWALARYRAASHLLDLSRGRHARAELEAAELLDLRARGEGDSLGERPAQDTLARLNAALQAAGLSPSRLKDLSRESDGPLPGAEDATRRLQTMRVTLEPIRPAELVAFLGHWRSPRQPWIVTRLELTHGGPPDDQDDRYAARLTIAAAYRTQTTPGARSSLPPSNPVTHDRPR